MSYLVLDIETVPDLTRWSSPADKPDAFPPVFAHRIVCVGTLWLTDAYSLIGDSWMLTGDERSVLSDLSRFLSANKPTLVTYNGRRFDLPVIVHRALLHGVQLPFYYQQRGARYRFSEEGHLDLADCLTDYGACSMATLDDVAKLCGLPGKVGVDGSDVAALYRDGKLDEIAAYCLADVAQTALLLLRYRLVQGELRHAEYELKRENLMAAFRRDPRIASLFGATSHAIPRGAPNGDGADGADSADAARLPQGGILQAGAQ